VIDTAERTLTKPRRVAGYDLPAGIRVYPAAALVQMREDLFPRAKEFRPERFLDGKTEAYSLIPFGGGIRRCIGAALANAEMAEVLRVMVPAVDLKLVREEPDPVVLRGVTLAPSHGVEVDVTGVRAPRAVALAPAA
jgi:unspecific monooxygenase